jgi:hypothetical protein
MGTHSIGFLEIEDQVQFAYLRISTTSAFLTYIPEITIQNLDITMYNLQSDQFIVPRRDGADEE